MNVPRVYRKTERSAEQQAELERIRSAPKSTDTTGDRIDGRSYNAVMQLIAELKSQRESLGIEQAELAERMGIAPSALCRLEMFRIVNPSSWTLMNWASALGYDLDFKLSPQSKANAKEPVA